MNWEEFRHWLRDWARGTQRPLVMGVLNVTPDSFSDGGDYLDLGMAVARAVKMAKDGVDMIDVGGESTRPGALPVLEDEQIRRVLPVIAGIRQQSSVVISIDTTRAAVAEAALEAGANVVNDISAARDDAGMFGLVRQHGAPIVLMHMQGTPAKMQERPTYRNVVEEVSGFLRERLDSARTAGIDPADVLLDPGFGFGKTVQHNLELLKHIDQLVAIGQPLVVGTSRKSFIGKITGETDRRVMGTAATVAWAVANGAAMVRVHDAEEMVPVVKMAGGLRIVGGNCETRGLPGRRSLRYVEEADF